MPRRARGIRFSDDELRTLVCVLDHEYHRTVRENMENGRPWKTDQTERLMALYRMIYGELIERHH